MSFRSESRSLIGISALILVAISVFALPAQGTVPVPGSDEHKQLTAGEMDLWLRGGPDGTRSVPEYLGPFNYLREFDQIVGFLAFWQLVDPDSSDHGGMIEAESGYLGDVIQTDNTLEAIWCWSRYREFSGRTTYDQNIADAWIYCTNYPAWQEEGGSGDDYYRVHNSAWGLTAVLQYKAATGDDSYDWYAETCAQYIVDHSLVIDGTLWNQRLDAFCKGWAAGNLYIYGQAVGNNAYMSAAAAQGGDVFNWINNAPILNMAAEYWAMSSGTSVWGVCNSYFQDEPGLGEAWLTINGHYLEIWEDWYSVPGYVWDNSWNVAYGNAHFAVYDILQEAEYYDNAQFIFDHLLSYDTDDDGGITAESIDLNDEDMSWVTCYLCKFGVDRLMGDPLLHDTGVLRFAGIADGDSFDLGDTIPIRLLATNYGLSVELNVEVNLSGDAGAMTQYHSLPFAALDTLDFISGWQPTEGGDLTLTASTALAGDLNPTNDAVSVSIHVRTLSALPSGSDVFARGATVTRNPFRRETGVRFILSTQSPIQLDIFDVSGRRVARLHDGVMQAGEHTMNWDGHDQSGRALPAGLYLYRIHAGRESTGGKIMRMR